MPGVFSSQELREPAFSSRKSLAESFRMLQKLLRPASFYSILENNAKADQMLDSTIRAYYDFRFTYQFRLLCVHPDYHILIKCRQQVTDAIILDREFLIAIIILTELQPLN